MSRTVRHRIEGKCRREVLRWKDQPINMIKKWNRRNNDWGEFRALKKELVETIMDKQLKSFTNGTE